jgi:predicted pyridoxine 5'-phosphate oxidase superfamily flavin-nucleotide-binding protein
MERLENTTVTAADQLATLYSPPSKRVLRKEIDHVDAVGRAFIAASPFLILATGGSQGLDCSPHVGAFRDAVQFQPTRHIFPDERLPGLCLGG